AADADREHRLPDTLVRRNVDVRPGERRERACEQHGGAARLGAEKLPERRLEVPRPGGAARERRGGRLELRRPRILTTRRCSTAKVRRPTVRPGPPRGGPERPLTSPSVPAWAARCRPRAAAPRCRTSRL